MNIKKNTKVYIACPYKYISGGPETLHQLVDKLRNKGYDAYIYYINFKNKEKEELPEKFKKYNVKIAKIIEDSEDNVLVVPETNTEIIYRYKNIRKSIWWLSVDFYWKSSGRELAKWSPIFKKVNIDNVLGKSIHNILSVYKTIKYKKFKMFDIINGKDKNKYFHMYNSEYGRKFLINHGIKEENMEYLCGPIDDKYIKDINIIKNKKNIVAYNPKKGKEFSQILIEYVNSRNPEIEFVAIQNMSLEQVENLLEQSKVYMDFGYFPGPERIPREAVVSFCNIITSNLGSAKNKKDILIPDKFKFDLDTVDINLVYETIIKLIYNYKEYVNEFECYRKKVYEQKNLFSKNIEVIFSKNNER
ncbi:hypothetical protein [Clostridium cuniculi]|uniref:hypothetical protein n=1 Tax=Clostridium cuniculi TaxID=2548455 RepID=UPI001056663E|nr:hypothetical protein [Clostridium cuniculi]